ncbi:MAG: 4Fe-4S binding protein [Oscillospiraceae bacterium]|nr:4Fe-4S binding protein [Oscillospiraceae bacterium]
MLINDGIPRAEDLMKVTPSDERFSKGPVVIVECFQEIPCDPCVKSCKRGAITMPNGINDIPVVDFDLCNGCSLCISMCPGLAIFVVDKTWSEDRARVLIPYEYLPIPDKGQMVKGLDRAGKELGSFEVIRVTSGGKKNKTWTISLAVPQALAMDVRGLLV